MSMTVCTGYWILSLGGESIMPYSATIINYYLHLVIGLQMIFELMLIEKNFTHEKYFAIDLVIISFLSILYAIILTYVSKTYDFSIYPFMKFELSQIIAVFIGLLSISFNAYVIAYFVIDHKNKKYKINKKVADYENNGGDKEEIL